MPLLSLTFARDLAPEQLLLRMGADPTTLALRSRDEFERDFGDVPWDSDEAVVQAGTFGNWAWAVEETSWRCVEDGDLVCRASVGTAAVVLHGNEKPMVEFRYAENGRLVTGINTLMRWHADGRTGEDPHRFDAELRALCRRTNRRIRSSRGPSWRKRPRQQ